VINADKETLQNAPGFEDDDWPDMTDPTWGSRVREHYKLSPDEPGSQGVGLNPGPEGAAGSTSNPTEMPSTHRR